MKLINNFALTLLAVSLPLTASADLYVAYDLGDSNGWQFGKEMKLVDGLYTYDISVSLNGNSAFFTFFDKAVTGWGQDATRYGYPNKEPKVQSGKQYTLKSGSEKCYEVSESGDYTITVNLVAGNDNASYVVFTNSGDNPIDPDPIVPDDPNIFVPSESDPNYSKYFPTDSHYVFFKKPSDWGVPYAWVWDANNGNANCNASGTWPGDEMKQYKEDYYIWVEPAGKNTPTNIIISYNQNNSEVKAGGGDLEFYDKATYHSDGKHYGGNVPDPDPIPVPSDNAGEIKSWKKDGETVTIECEKATIYVTPYDKQLVKVFALPAGMSGEERKSISVVATPDIRFAANEDEDGNLVIDIEAGASILVDRETGLLSFYTDNDRQTLKLKEKNYLNNINGAHTVAFEPMNDDAFYGGGYNEFGSIKNHSMVMNNTQTGNWDMNSSPYPHNICIPFVASTNGYGILFDDHWRGAKMTPSSDGVKYESGAQNPIAYYFVGGEDLDDVLANYTHLTGRQELPPMWALGYLTSRYGYRSETEAREVISKIKGMGLPLDGLVFDLNWQGADESGMGNLNWYAPNFPNPRKMLGDFKDQGVHTLCITEPFFTSSSANYQALKNNGYFADNHVNNMEWLRSSDVGLLDASNPDALNWMWDFYKARTEEGVDGWWLDLGEPEQHDSDSNHKGGSVDQVHNEFGQLWVESVYNGLKRDFSDKRPVLLPRSGTAGMQRFSVFPWTGDIRRSFPGLHVQIPSLVNSAMSGVSYLGSDIGGFISSGTNPNLYLRWVELGAVTPMMRTHSSDQPEPYNDCYKSVQDGIRKFIRLRYRMLPYLYTLCYQNTEYGWPVARPACAFDTDKSKLAACDDAYLWGKDLFVAPVVDDATSRSITFPEGRWMDMNDILFGDSSKKPSIFKGHDSYTYNAPLDCLPFFIKDGGFLPMFTQTAFDNTTDLKYEDLTLYHLITDRQNVSNTTQIYEDDGASTTSLSSGDYGLMNVSVENDWGSVFIVRFEKDNERTDAGDRVVRMHLYGYPSNVLEYLEMKVSDSRRSAPRSGFMAPAAATQADIKMCSSQEEADAYAGSAVYHDTSRGRVYLKTMIPAGKNAAVYFADVPTLVEQMESNSAIRVDYCNGMLNYMAPSGYDNAMIEVMSADGCVLARFTGLQADGLMHSVEAPEATGFCLVRLTARNAASHPLTATTKYIR